MSAFSVSVHQPAYRQELTRESLMISPRTLPTLWQTSIQICTSATSPVLAVISTVGSCGCALKVKPKQHC